MLRTTLIVVFAFGVVIDAVRPDVDSHGAGRRRHAGGGNPVPEMREPTPDSEGGPAAAARS